MRKLAILWSLISVLSAPAFAENYDDLKDKKVQIENFRFSDKIESASEKDKQLIIGIMNDSLTPQMTDRHLTSELKIGYMSEKLPSFFDWYTDEYSENYYIVTLTQQIYTPEDIENPELIEEDRPYAGWAHLTFAIAKNSGRDLEMTVLDFGVIGEKSFAADTQIWLHELIGSDDPNGWEHQLNDEIGINLTHARARNFRVEDERFAADITPYVIGSIGNVNTSVTTGVMARFGLNVPDDNVLGFEPANEEDETRLYGFATINASYVARDIFLDGNTFSDSHSVEKNNFVGRAAVGVAYKYGNFEFSYAYGITSEQFKTQDGPNFGGQFFINYKKRF